MALQLVDIDHRYGRRQSLCGVRMTVERGDCYGFIGHNGAGKTTTLRIALGLDRPAAGRVLIDGFDARAHPLEARARLGGMIETTGFYPWSSARENLIELARLQGLARRDSLREADRWLDVVGLGDRARSAVRTFSQGMRQRLGLAQALLGEPAYVLLDEPQNGLDPEGIADLREVLRRLTRDCHMTVVLSSHQLHELTGLCNRIGVLRQGRLLLEADTEALLAATRSRYELATDDRSRTDAVLDRLGIRRVPGATGPDELVDLGEVAPAAIVRALVHADVGVARFAPRPATLEEVYLRLATEPNAERTVTQPPPAVVASTPAERRAPRHAVLRMLGYELRRNATRWPSALLVLIPTFLAWQRISGMAEDQAVYLAQVQSGRLHSTSTVTAFEAFGRGLAAAIPALAVTFVAVGSQSIAGELSLGTLRNVLIRPLRRSQISVGKALAILVALLVALGAAVGAAWVSAGAYFDFGDRFEITKAGAPEPWFGAEAVNVWPLVPDVLLAPILPLFAYAGIGFLVGALASRAIWALGIALGAVVAIDLGRVFARPLGFEAWLPSAYLPSPLGDTSFLSYFVDVSIGSAEAVFLYEQTAWIVPIAWCVAAFGLGALLVSRKRVA